MTSYHDLTKFERAKIIGYRSLQISNGAPIFIPYGDDDIDPLSIAKNELRAGKTPMVIKRFFDDGSFLEIKLRDLIPVIEVTRVGGKVRINNIEINDE